MKSFGDVNVAGVVVVLIIIIVFLALVAYFCCTDNMMDTFFNKQATEEIIEEEPMEAQEDTQLLEKPEVEEAPPSIDIGDKNAHSDVKKMRDMYKGGRNVTLYSKESSEKIRLSIFQDELRWETQSYFKRKRCMAKIDKMTSVIIGKSSFENTKAKATLDENTCLSIIGSVRNIDIKTNSKIERDILAAGMTILLTKV